MKTFIIAEAGVNHNGSLDTAKLLIDAASDSGADAVKFQTFKTESLVVKGAEKAKYQKIGTNASESQFDMIRRLELSREEHQILIEYCDNRGITFLSTPFDLDSVDMLNDLGLKIIKIPSGEITNLPYLRYIGALNKKIILSTGMSTLQEVEDALNILNVSGTVKENVTVLHANTMYPTPMRDVNLNAMLTLRDRLNVAIGYSDHTLGIEVDIAAVAMGATIIEKHFTLDKAMPGPDHKASLDPEELKTMVLAIRNIEEALGSADKKPSPSESENITVARKSIVASKQIRKGDLLSDKNITTKRPGLGMSPMEWDSVVGSVASQDYNIDDFI